MNERPRKKSVKKKKGQKKVPNKSNGEWVDPKVVQMSPADLSFDLRNPRIVETELDKNSSETDFIKTLWKELAVEEVATSIAANGYFPHEYLFAVKSGNENVVIEGNRRLAAVKLLLNPTLLKHIGANLPKPTAATLKSLESIPVFFTTREDSWKYIGFKHVNGPRPWGAWSKAEYIARVHNEYGVSLKDLSTRIGDRHDTVQRLYRGLMTIRQVDKTGEWKIADRWNKRLYFSHLYTGLSYEGIQDFIGMKESTSYRPNPIRGKANVKKLGELCMWMFGSKSREFRPLIKSQNPDLRDLNTTVETERGIDALRVGMPLRAAYDISLGDERIFGEAMTSAKGSLQKAAGTVLTGYKGKGDLYSLGEDIYKLAGNILDEMDAARTAGSKRRRGTKKS